MDLEQLHDKIETYLNKRMSKEEQEDFEQQIREDANIKQEVAIHVLANEAVYLAIEDDVKNKLDAIRVAHPLPEKPDATIVPFWQRRPFQLAIAACLVGVVAIVTYLSQSQIEAEPISPIMAIAELERVYPSAQEKGTGTDLPWTECISSFEQQQYAQAIECFNKYDSTDPKMLLYVAHSYLRMEQFKTAKSQFEQLLAREDILADSRLRTNLEYNWFVALALDQDKRLAPLLDSVLSIPAYTFYQEAQQLRQLTE